MFKGFGPTKTIALRWMYYLFDIQSDALILLQNLEILELLSTALSDFKENSFRNLKNLTRLVINSSKNIVIKNFYLEGFDNLKNLDLRMNGKLEAIESDSFIHMSKLEILRLELLLQIKLQ